MRLFRAVLLPIALLAVSISAAELPPWRLDSRVSPLHQDVRLNVDPARDGYHGTTQVELRVSERVDSFRLHAEEMEIRSLGLERAGRSIPVTFEKQERAILRVVAETPLAPGDDYVLTIDFANEYDRRAVGLYKAVVGGVPYAFTQFQATDARKAFPTWDEPGFKYPFRLTLVVPEGVDAVSNTPIVAVEPAGEGKRIRFARTKPVPAYLVAIAVGEFEFTEIKGMSVPGNIVTVKGRSGLTALAAAEIPRSLAEMERYFGRSYPYEKLDFIAIPEFWPGAMEHPGAITFAENILLLDETQSTLSQRRTQAKIIAHELAHQWFGNLVTMKWWDDFWLSESFADWVGDEIASRVHPSWQIHEGELENVQQIMAADGRASADPIRRGVIEAPEAIVGSVGLAYNKGKAVLDMFEAWVGEESFRKGIIRYLERNAWKNAESVDLWRALAAEGKKELPVALETFLVQPGFPIIRIAAEGKGRVRLTQEPFHVAGSEPAPRTWLVPVSLRYSTGGDSAETIVLLDEKSKVFRLADADLAWVFPQADAVGYYRWSLPADRMLELAVNARERLTPAERIAFLGNVSALLDAGEIAGDVYMQLIQRFASDPDPLILAAVLPQIGKIETSFVTPEHEDEFATWVRDALGPALERIGFTSRPGEPETLAPVRAQLVTRLGEEGNDEEVLAWAVATAARYRRDPASVDPSLALPALTLAASRGDKALFEEFRLRFETAATPVDRGRYLAAIAAFDEPELRDAALAYALKGPLRSNELLQLAFGVADDPASRERLYEWTTTNWDAITGRIPPFTIGFLPFVAGGCEPERIARAEKFFAEPEHRTEGTGAQMAKVADQVAQCAALRAREGARVEAFLLKP